MSAEDGGPPRGQVGGTRTSAALTATSAWWLLDPVNRALQRAMPGDPSRYAFGSTTLRWADQRFAHRFAGGPPPVRPPKYGQARARHEWKLWARALAGWAVVCGLLGLAVLAVDDSVRRRT